jgi:hypothetical protein
MYVFVFENGTVHRQEYTSYLNFMADAQTRGLNAIMYYPGNDGYVVRLSTAAMANGSRPTTMIMHAANPTHSPISDVAFYKRAFAWLDANPDIVQHLAYTPLMAVGDGPFVLKPQLDSGSNWSRREYNEWADNSMDVFTRYLCMLNYKKKTNCG